jgi:competence protein ComEC
MRRPLLALAAAFGSGCLVAGAGGGASEALALAGLALALLLLSLATSPRWGAAALAVAALGLGAAAAEVEALRFEAGPLRRRVLHGAWNDVSVRLTGTVAGDAVPLEGRLRVLLDVEAAEARGRRQSCRGRVSLEIGGESALPTLPDGARVAVWARLRPTRWREGRREGLAARGFCKSSRLLRRLEIPGGGPVRQVTARLRAWIRRRLQRAILPGPERGLVLALVLGDRSELDEETAEGFRASGTYHVLALSGAHVALVAGLLTAGLRRLRFGPAAEAVLTGTALWLYALLVGGDVPVVRAAFMASALLAGRALDLPGDAGNLLGLAGLVLLLAHPSHAWDVGFQLSFGATLGILLLMGPLARGWPALPLRAEMAVAASVAAQAVLSPILAGWFHRLAPAALVLNLAAVPLSGAVLLSGFAVVVLGPVVPVTGDIAWIAAHTLRASANLGPLGPWLDLRVAAPSSMVVAVQAAGLVQLARGRRGAGLALLLASHLGLLAGPAPPAADGRLHMVVLDVGQGDSILLRSPGGRVLLVDAGGSYDPRYDVGERRVAPVLWATGVRVLEALVLTHAHPDHVGGAPFLLRAFRVEEVWEGPAPLADAAWQRLDRALRRARVARRTLVRGDRLEWDGVQIRVLGPAPPGRPPLHVRNEDSLVLSARLGKVTFLLAGDVLGEAEAALDVPSALVVKVPHHGSRSSSAPAFVRRAAPRVALISAGARNPFGHPHPEVIARYTRAGALVLRTDRDGAVEVATDGQRLWARASAEPFERRIR